MQNNSPKHVELTGIINKPLLLRLVGCLYYLYQWCTVKQISDNEIYLLIKYIKNVLWRTAKRLSYIEDARCLKVKTEVLGMKAWRLLMLWGVRWLHLRVIGVRRLTELSPVNVEVWNKDVILVIRYCRFERTCYLHRQNTSPRRLLEKLPDEDNSSKIWRRVYYKLVSHVAEELAASIFVLVVPR